MWTQTVDSAHGKSRDPSRCKAPISAYREALATPHPSLYGRYRHPCRFSSRSLQVMWPLLAFTGLYILVYAGESVKYASCRST